MGKLKRMRPSALAGAGRLIDVHGAVRILIDFQADAVERLRILLQRRQIFVLDDRRRHVPGRIDGDELHLRRGHRRRLGRLAGDDLGLPVQTALVEQAQRVVGHVDDDIVVVVVAELARQPAPALHVDDDGVDRIGGRALGFRFAPLSARTVCGAGIAVDVEILLGLERLHRFDHSVVIERVVLVAGDVEALAQRDHALVLHAGAQNAAVRHVHVGARIGLFLRRLDDLARHWRAVRRAPP